MKKILLTGANGFIGKEFLNLLSNEFIEIIAVVKNANTDLSFINGLKNVRVVFCDMVDVEKLTEKIIDRDIDICVHLAWAGSFGEARSCYELQLQNVIYSLNLINILPKLGVKRFVGAGTLAELDVLNYHPLDGATPNPVSHYGIAKVTAHYMTKTECSKLGIEHVWCFLSNTYGIGNTTNNFVNMAVRLMLQNKRASFTSGEQFYDFVYITDTVRGLYYATLFGKPNVSYYIGSNQARPLKEYIKIIRDTVDPNIELFLGEIPFKGTPLPKEAYNATKLFKDTGYKPLVSFEDGILKTVLWLKNNI